MDFPYQTHTPWDPDPASERGPTLTVRQTLGASAAGGADALLGRQTLDGLAANDDGFASRRLERRLPRGGRDLETDSLYSMRYQRVGHAD